MVALSSAAGLGGRAVVRLSGSTALPLAASLLSASGRVVRPGQAIPPFRTNPVAAGAAPAGRAASLAGAAQLHGPGHGRTAHAGQSAAGRAADRRAAGRRSAGGPARRVHAARLPGRQARSAACRGGAGRHRGGQPRRAAAGAGATGRRRHPAAARLARGPARTCSPTWRPASTSPTRTSHFVGQGRYAATLAARHRSARSACPGSFGNVASATALPRRAGGPAERRQEQPVQRADAGSGPGQRHARHDPRLLDWPSSDRGRDDRADRHRRLAGSGAKPSKARRSDSVESRRSRPTWCCCAWKAAETRTPAKPPGCKTHAHC